MEEGQVIPQVVIDWAVSQGEEAGDVTLVSLVLRLAVALRQARQDQQALAARVAALEAKVP